ncbi:MAG: amidohydrolase family protein [Mycobacteriales bacterium]
MLVTPDLHVRGVLLPGYDERDLWVRAGTIAAGPVPGVETVARSGFVLPGLVDAHCHIGLSPAGIHHDHAGQLAQAYTERDVGALLLRDAGSPVDTRWLQHRDDVPRLIRAGRHLARTGRYLRDLALELEPEQLPDAIEAQARAGDGWVKIVGDWIDRSVGDLAPEWPRETVFQAVRRAHAAGAKVAVHTFGEEALPDLIEAGVDSIEHGTGLTDDLIGAMAARGIALVPTLINVDNFPAIAESASRFPAYAARMRRLHESSRARLRAAYDAGVPIYAGTDAGGQLPHGRVVDEIRALHDAGLSASDALAAGSWGAREWLGCPSLSPGAPADFVVYDRDPRTDLAVLAEPARIVLRGKVVR